MHTSICMYTCIHIYVFGCFCTHIHIHRYTSMFIHMYVYMQIYIYIVISGMLDVGTCMFHVRTNEGVKSHIGMSSSVHRRMSHVAQINQSLAQMNESVKQTTSQNL